ncbi:MAG: hypothetical protein DSY81_01550 [Bacillota bacterium]|nr:MAG: hypothetical protein DSY92_11570 [Planctomycetota bacterium]RUA11099.1 MAG: hypothetical protein DSY81_01550 [Bacillota bacterium]
MVDTNRRRRFAPFMGALFCVFLVLIEHAGQIAKYFIFDGPPPPMSLNTFLWFLPMCFLFMGFALKAQDDRTQGRIQALETALAARDEKTTE